MSYIETIFTVIPNETYVKDILSASLAEIGYESFVADENNLTAYIPNDLFNNDLVQKLISNLVIEAEVKFQFSEIENQNWNETWEKNFFEPIVIGNDCVVKSSFHTETIKAKHTIIINPKMSFGTGHHETTSLMMQFLLEEEMFDKNVLDMGCGTSVLAILAEKMGAKKIVGIDIDEWAYNNSKENLELNKCSKIILHQGGAELLQDMKYDIILANINRNILLNDMHKYISVLSDTGTLYLSGFYKDDISVLEKKANKFNLKLERFKEKNNWVALKLTF